MMCVQEQMVEPAVRGTEYVINAAVEAGTVRRVVFTSSIGAVTMDPSRGPDVVVDETCWSDLEFCKKTRVGAPSLFLIPFLSFGSFTAQRVLFFFFLSTHTYTRDI
jgi:hypothetical protein